MDCFDFIVVGSGPGATFASYGLRGSKVAVLDVGADASATSLLQGNIYEQRRRDSDLFEPLIGESFEGLHNLHQPPISLKLKAPYMSYIVKGSTSLAPVVSTHFEGAISLAKGGLANGWGGYLGQQLAKHLHRLGHAVAGSARKPDSLPFVSRLQPLDLGSVKAADVFAGVDVVIHAAHDFDKGQSAKNIAGTRLLCYAATQQGVSRQVFLSSYSSRPDAVSEYGRTKYAWDRFFSRAAIQ